MVKYAYCKHCDKEVEKPIREPMQTFQKVIWVMLSIATLGIGLIIFIIIYANRTKDFCPTCRRKLEISGEPIKKEKEEEPLTAREKVLKKAGKAKEKKDRTERETPSESEEEEEKEQTFCPYCGEDIEAGIKRCPYCHSALKAFN